MPDDAVDRKSRTLIVTPGNLRNHHLYIGRHSDFFPADCAGPPRKPGQASGRGIEIVLDGLNEIVETDIGADAKTGKPRNFFRGRTWVRRFFEYHHVSAGDALSLDKLSVRRFRLRVERRVNGRPPAVRAAEFFAGIGLEINIRGILGRIPNSGANYATPA